jgi:kynurenine 3-monooxygenase
MGRVDSMNYEQTFIDHGYKELTIPAGADGGFQMDARHLHIWPRQSFMMIALPNQARSQKEKREGEREAWDAGG